MTNKFRIPLCETDEQMAGKICAPIHTLIRHKKNKENKGLCLATPCYLVFTCFVYMLHYLTLQPVKLDFDFCSNNFPFLTYLYSKVIILKKYFEAHVDPQWLKIINEI